MGVFCGNVVERVVGVDEAPVLCWGAVICEGVVFLERGGVEVEELAFATVEVLGGNLLFSGENFELGLLCYGIENRGEGGGLPSSCSFQTGLCVPWRLSVREHHRFAKSEPQRRIPASGSIEAVVLPRLWASNPQLAHVRD